MRLFPVITGYIGGSERTALLMPPFDKPLTAAVAGPYRVASGSVYVPGATLGSGYIAGPRNAVGYVAGAQIAKAIT